jgi:hypothetical protein
MSERELKGNNPPKCLWDTPEILQQFSAQASIFDRKTRFVAIAA